MALLWSCRFWEVPRYGDVIRHSAEERPITHTFFGNGKIGNAFQHIVK